MASLSKKQKGGVPLSGSTPIQTDDAVWQDKSNALWLTDIHTAVLYGKPRGLTLLIHSGADVKSSDQSGHAALHTAPSLSLPQKEYSLDVWEVEEQMVGCVWDHEEE